MNEIDLREFGKLEAQVEQLNSMVVEMRADIKDLKDGWNKTSGGMKVLLAVAAILGGFVTQFINWALHKI